MKLKFVLLTMILACMTGVSAYAAIGDVIGNTYTTDIAADVDGMPIKSYNIGGKTALVVEDLRNYGFYVEWKEAERLLVVKTEYMPISRPEYSHIKEAPGNIAGDIYETDIRTTINGIEVPSFCLDGVTAVAIEEMVDLPYERYSYDGNAHQGMARNYADTGMYYVWNPEARTISLNTLRPGEIVETDFGNFTIATQGGYSVERMMYVRSPKSFAGLDGKYYATYADAIETHGEIYVMLSELEEMLGAEIYVDDASINLKLNVKNAIQMQYANSLTAKTCDNILYPLAAELTVNENPAENTNADFYLYKGDVFVALSAINSAAGKTIFRDRYNSLPDNAGKSLGKILYSKDIIYFNGKAVASYLADNGKYYIPADELEKAKFIVYTSPDSRVIEAPKDLPGVLTPEDNFPSTYFLQDYEGKGYLCEYYEGFHKVSVCGTEVEAVYIHFPDTHLTPCVTLDELILAGGFIAEKSGGNTFVYTRDDRLTLGVSEDLSEIVIYKNGEIAKSFSSQEYHDANVFGKYLVMNATGDRFGISEIYEAESLNMLFEIEGTVSSMENDRILAYKNTEVDGEWARKFFVYDMSGNLIETYVGK